MAVDAAPRSIPTTPTELLQESLYVGVLGGSAVALAGSARPPANGPSAANRQGSNARVIGGRDNLGEPGSAPVSTAPSLTDASDSRANQPLETCCSVGW